MKKGWHIAFIIILVPLTLFLVSTAVIVHMAPLIHGLIDRYSWDATDAHATLIYYYTYIASPTSDLPVIPGMTDAELQHLRDVRTIWRWGIVAAIVAAVLMGVMAWRAQKKKVLATGLEWGSLATILLMIAASLVPFDQLWIWFHSLTFPQGNWVFSYNSKIIQLFPPAFFQAAVLRIGLLTLFFAIVTYGVATLLKKLSARKVARSAKDSPLPSANR